MILIRGGLLGKGISLGGTKNGASPKGERGGFARKGGP